jgi:hypothetical protein
MALADVAALATRGVRDMDWKPVEDSAPIAAVGYDEAHKVLAIAFTSGGVWEYADVSRATYEALLSAESMGRYFTYRIRGHYSSKAKALPVDVPAAARRI